jgi:DNA (cytosine-5)-methyltransferase 1
MTHGSLFSGIGGFDAGAGMAGFTNLYNCETNPFCNRYLKKNYPNAVQYPGIETIQTPEKTTVISAGFPCQDISVNGKGSGIFGAQSALFFEALRVIDVARPPFVLLENSPAILKRGMHFILAALAKIGYMCEWECLCAYHFGYPHKRERIYIIAYPVGKRLRHMVFRPIKAIDLCSAWTSTPVSLRVSAIGAKPSGISGIISPIDVVPGYAQYIHALGNAVMPAVAEYLFKCIKIAINDA